MFSNSSHNNRRLSMTIRGFPTKMDGSFKRVSTQFGATRFDRNVSKWVKLLNRMDVLNETSRDFRNFTVTFSSPTRQNIKILTAVYPKLNLEGKTIIHHHLPADFMARLSEDQAVSLFNHLSCEPALILALRLFEKKKHLDSEVMKILIKKMRCQGLSSLMLIFKKYSDHPGMRVIFNFLPFDLKFLITGNSGDGNHAFLRDYWADYKRYMTESRVSCLKTLITLSLKVDSSFFYASILVLNDSQRLFLLPFLPPESFTIVQDLYIKMFDHIERNELTECLKMSSGAYLNDNLEQIYQKSQSNSIDEYFKEDARYRQKYINSIQRNLGSSIKRKLVCHMMDNQSFFSVQMLFENLCIDAQETPSCRETRRILLFCKFYLIYYPEVVFGYSSIFKKLTNLKPDSRESKFFVKILLNEVENAKRIQFSRDILNLLLNDTSKNERDIILKATLGYSYFTSTSVMIELVIDQLKDDSFSSQYKNRLMNFLTCWLKYRATDKEFKRHNHQLQFLVENSDKSDSDFCVALSIKQSVIKHSSKLEESSIGSKDMIEFDDVLSRVGNRLESHEDFTKIAEDLKNYALELFSAISIEEFISLEWLKQTDELKPICQMIGEWNRLSKLVAVKMLNPDLDPVRRARVFEFFIDLCDKLYQEGDIHSSYAIHCALISTEVSRLKETWKYLSSSQQKVNKKLSSLFDVSGNHKKIRTHMKWLIDNGKQICPCINFISQDLTNISENLDDVEFNHLNIAKFDALTEIFKEFHRWHMLCRVEILPRSHSNVRESVDTVNLSEDLWKLSRECRVYTL